MKKEIIFENGTKKEVVFVTASECKTKSNKQLLNLLKNNDIRNIRECGCSQEGCAHRGGRGTMKAVLAVGRGHGFRYLCPAHYGLNGLNSYHSGDTDVTFIGKKKNTDLASTTVGIEFEIVLKNEKNTPLLNIFRTSLANFASCRQEEDGTVSAEFPTGAFIGINSLSKLLDSFEKYGVLEALTNNSECGAHIHAGIVCEIEYIGRNYRDLFKPLADKILAMKPENRVKFFGSDFRDWAEYPDWYNPQNHTNIINTQHQHTLELRLPRCVSSKQYIQCCKAWRAVVCEINTHYTEETAEQIGKKLPEVFEKYYNFMNDHEPFSW